MIDVERCVAQIPLVETRGYKMIDARVRKNSENKGKNVANKGKNSTFLKICPSNKA
jgi:hypothetical protein